ncbi:caspase recruitment domain-containing protein 16 isoform X2 [Eublepharis macularius]|uniref:Caspase recruitment domain-containing protein 16 isoform X2 n=1 Tax=Eublepharis macularius TaxID=481883 RepID=A0AA97KLU0_EUBMA|nr:caspase recruitment domain-containing protein 16 isoform X2 [Eublepharis macularius]
MADTKLREVRTQFVAKVNKAVIYGVLDDLQEEQVLNEAETEEVKQQSTLTQEQARMLIDGVRRKGPSASLIAIKCLCSRDAFLAEELGLKAFLAELEGNLR